MHISYVQSEVEATKKFIPSWLLYYQKSTQKKTFDGLNEKSALAKSRWKLWLNKSYNIHFIH